MDLKTGQAVVLPRKGEGFNPAEIPAAVKKAGFSPGPIRITAVGTLESGNTGLWLEMPGPVSRLILTGDKAKQLRGQKGVIGQRLRVDGTLQPAARGQPPAMLVESWTRAASTQ